MSDVNWNLGLAPDVGMNVLAAFKQGQQERKQQDTQNALADFANNPRDASALQRVTTLDPRLGMALREKLTAEQQQEVAKRIEAIGQAAQWADTPEKWDQAIDYLAQSGIDVAQYKGKFSPELRMSAISSSGELKSYLDRTAPISVGPGTHLVDPTTGKPIFSAPFAPRAVTVKDGETVVEYAPGSNGFKGGFDGFYSGFLAGAEGGYNPKDPMSGAPVNFGIDQRANPDINVQGLTQDQAKQILHDRYWKPSGANQIDNPALQAIHADTAINMGVGASQQLLQQSGGDPQKYLQLREQRYREIGGPALQGWLNRNENLRQFVGLGPAGSRVIAQGAPKKEKPKDAPAGYRWKADGSLEPIPGGPADKSPNKDPGYPQSAMDAFDRAINTANGLLKHPGFSSAVGVKGLGGGLLGGWVVPGTDAADFRTNLETMKAQVFLPMVQSMKGMGALSNAEGEKLTAAIGNLSVDQSEKQFQQNVQQIIADLTTYRNRATQPAKPAQQGAKQAVQAQTRKPSVSNW